MDHFCVGHRVVLSKRPLVADVFCILSFIDTEEAEV